MRQNEFSLPRTSLVNNIEITDGYPSGLRQIDEVLTFSINELRK